MAKYNLSTGIVDSFTFTVTDPQDSTVLEYELRYPSANDFEPTKALDAQIDEYKVELQNDETTSAYKKEIQAKIDDLEKQKAEMFYKLVTPVGHDRPIMDVLNRVNILVVKNFNKMVSGELGA